MSQFVGRYTQLCAAEDQLGVAPLIKIVRQWHLIAHLTGERVSPTRSATVVLLRLSKWLINALVKPRQVDGLIAVGQDTSHAVGGTGQNSFQSEPGYFWILRNALGANINQIETC